MEILLIQSTSGRENHYSFIPRKGDGVQEGMESSLLRLMQWWNQQVPITILSAEGRSPSAREGGGGNLPRHLFRKGIELKRGASERKPKKR